MESLSQIGAITLVLGLLGGTLWVLRRRGIAGIALRAPSAKRRLEDLERLPLAPQHTLHLVRLDDKVLLLASSPGGCGLVQETSK